MLSLPSFCPCRQLGYVQTINCLAIVWNFYLIFFSLLDRLLGDSPPPCAHTHTGREQRSVEMSRIYMHRSEGSHPGVAPFLIYPPKSSHFSNLTLHFLLQLGFYFPAESEFLVPQGWGANSAEKLRTGSFKCWLPSSSCLLLIALQCPQIDIVCILFHSELRGLRSHIHYSALSEMKLQVTALLSPLLY